MIYIRQNYRIYPNQEQTIILAQWLGQARFIWNHMLDLNIESYKQNQKFIFEFDMNNLLPSIKNNQETIWLKEIPSQALQQKCSDLSNALKSTGKQQQSRKGFPKFKSKKSDTSGFRLPSFKYNYEENKIYLPKLKSGIKTKFDRLLQGKASSITVYKNKCNQWFVSIVVQIEKPSLITEIKNSIGIDLGIKAFAVTSDAEIINNPKFYSCSESRVSRYHKQHSRKQKGSRNKEKTRYRLAKLHQRIANQRKDFTNKLSSVITKQNDLIAIENLNVSGMIKNRKLSKSISDASWGMFISTLKWHCTKRGKHLVQINKWYPSSKTCSHCNSLKETLTLSERTYECNFCGISIDRDFNASVNILNEGLRLYTEGTSEIHACGGDIPDMILEVGESAQETESLLRFGSS